MKRLLIITCLALALVPTAVAQTKKENIRELLVLMGAEEQYGQSIKTMVPMMLRQYQSSATEAQRKILTDFANKEGKVMMKTVLDQDITAYYEKTFTDGEIRDILAFYKTPAGKKLVKSSPEIQQELSQVMMKKYLPEFQKKLAAKMKEIK
jgi:hypothetical protein